MQKSKTWLPVLAAALLFHFAGVCSDDPPPKDSPGRDELIIGCEYDYPPYCIVKENGEADGFSIELIKAAAKSVGKNVAFKTGYWADLKKELADGGLHALPLVARTEERDKVYDFTFPYLTMHGAIVAREGDSRIKAAKDLEGKEVLVLKGDSSEEYMQRAGLNAKIVAKSTFSEAMRELSGGRCDALVIQRLLALQLMKETGVENLRIAAQIPGFVQHFCFAVREGDKETLALLNEGLSIVMADGTFRQLQAKWFVPFEAMEHRKSRIVVGGDNDYPPYEFLDANGQPAGFNVDLTRALARQIGVSVDIQLGPWSKIRNDLREGKIDIIQGMFYSPERDKTFRFSPPHTLVEYVVVERKGGGGLNGVDDLKDRVIIVQSGDIMHDLALNKGYGKEIIAVESQEDALLLLSGGKGDCAIVAKIPALYFIEKNRWGNLVLSGDPILSPEYCYSAMRGRESPLDIFIPALAAIKKTGEYRDIQTKWFGPYEREAHYRTILKYVAAIAALLLLLLVISMVSARSLKRLVVQRTKELVAERNALQISEGKFKYIFDNMSSSVVVYEARGDGEDFIFRDFNRAAEKAENISKSDIVGKSVLEVFPGVRDFGLFEVFKRVWKTGRPEQFPLAFYKDDRISGWRENYICKLPSGEIVAIYEDVTERKKADETLREREEENRFLLNNTSDFIARFDPDGIMLYCTEASLRFHGYEPRELINTSGFDNIHPEDRERVREKLKRLVETGSAAATEYRLRRKDGEYMWVEATGRLVSNPAGGKEVIVVQRDITERRKLEERLRQSEKMEAIGTLAGGIAHDFNNQLTGIMGYAEALRSRLDDAGLREYAENIMRAARRSADLTRDLLAFSRKGKFQTVPVDMHRLIEEVVSLLQHSIGKNIEIRRVFNASAATVKGDPSQLENALLNLAINARDAMPDGGTLTISTDIASPDGSGPLQPPPELPPDRYLCVCVADTGHGMDKEVMKHIFEPFFTTKEPGKGTGMGLASVFGTVKGHNGTISVSSSPGEGSAFSIYLPLFQDERKSDGGKGPARGSASKLHFLVVDDEEMIRELLALILRSQGHDVVLCEDGPSALDFYGKFWRGIDLVLLDIEMPRMHGRDVFAKIRAINPDAAVILVSGYSVEGEAQKLMDAGARAFLHKPFDMDELARALKTARVT